MTAVPEDDDPNALSRRLSESYAAVLGTGDWSLDGAEALLEGRLPEEVEPLAEAEPVEGVPESPPVSQSWIPAESEIPPTPRQIIEALLFVSNEPITPAAICNLIRGFQPKLAIAEIAELNAAYERQGRPYRAVPKGAGYHLELLPAFRPVQARLREGGRSLALSQAALEVLSMIAYRQPISKPDIERVRPGDAGPTLRQLLRYGVIAPQANIVEGRKVPLYATTGRFLELFGLRSLDDLPRLGETEELP